MNRTCVKSFSKGTCGVTYLLINTYRVLDLFWTTEHNFAKVFLYTEFTNAVSKTKKAEIQRIHNLPGQSNSTELNTVITYQNNYES